MSEKQRFLQSLVFPSFFILCIWLVKISEATLDINLIYLGLFPLKWRGLTGILTGPLIHADYKHLIDNSFPVFILSVAIFYFYKPVAYQVFFLTYIITGICVWLIGRTAYHIGASGLIYGFASFLFFSGIIRNNINLLAISLLVVFLYGGLVWGIFPFDYMISWESHLSGALIGLFLAIAFRKYGPPLPEELPDEDSVDIYEDENDDSSDNEN